MRQSESENKVKTFPDMCFRPLLLSDLRKFLLATNHDSSRWNNDAFQNALTILKIYTHLPTHFPYVIDFHYCRHISENILWQNKNEHRSVRWFFSEEIKLLWHDRDIKKRAV